MKKWFFFSLIFFCFCFITLNSYIIWKQDSKAQHTVYVKDWTRIQERNVIKTLGTKGILMPQEEYKVYFDDTDKEFLRFLVKEGDEVTIGTPLLEYETPELDKLRDTLETNISQAEGELSSIDEYIAKLLDYQASISSSTSSYALDSVFSFEDNLSFTEDTEDTSNDVIISQIEQEIYKQELEKSKLQDQIFNYETQISLINEKSDSAMIVSESDGIVKEVNDQLGNPVMTIASTTLSIKGSLTEEQLKKVEVDMPFHATVSGETSKLEGTIFDISSFPENEPEIGKANVYPFEALLTEQAEALPIGVTADLSITLDQALQVPTAPRKAIVKQGEKTFLYFLNKYGIIERKAVNTGLASGELQEIQEGTEIGQIVMTSNQAHDNSKFTTTMNPAYLKKESLTNLSSIEKWEAFLIGVVER